MNYYDFLLQLESIALTYGFRLIMNRAPVGCGFIFYFKDDKTGDYSRSYAFNLNHCSTKELFHELKRIAVEFKLQKEKLYD